MNSADKTLRAPAEIELAHKAIGSLCRPFKRMELAEFAHAQLSERERNLPLLFKPFAKFGNEVQQIAAIVSKIRAYLGLIRRFLPDITLKFAVVNFRFLVFGKSDGNYCYTVAPYMVRIGFITSHAKLD